MKKSFFILTAFTVCAVSILLFPACNKHEGVYKPKEKISKIYYEETEGSQVTTAKKLKETWTWEKKKLSKIEIADGQTLKFSYDGNQVSKIEGDNMIMNFSYEKKKLDKIEIFQHGTLSVTITVSDREGDDKITKLTYETQPATEYQKNVANDLAQMNPVINLLFPNAIATTLLSDMNETKPHKATVSTIVYEYTYNGNNITKTKKTDATGETITIYQYDNKTNPYYKSLYYFQEKPLVGISENNITLYYDEDKKMFQTNYEFKYNEDDLPISIALVDEVTTGEGKVKRSKIDYIEYVE
jgi:hypothetical protein